MGEPKQIDILMLLCENNGRYLTKSDIMNSVWGDVVVSDNNITKHISKLKFHLKSLGVDKILQSRNMLGYKISISRATKKNKLRKVITLTVSVILITLITYI